MEARQNSDYTIQQGAINSFLMFEGIPGMTTQRIILPKMPDPKTIDGYDLPQSEQYFRRTEIPDYVTALSTKKKLSGENYTKTDIIRELKTKKEGYKAEWDFINREWQRRFSGYWFWNNGTPTYITGIHYFYLNYWRINIGKPEYRDVDRRYFLYVDKAMRDPTCYGIMEIGRRQYGKTYRAGCVMYCLVSSQYDCYGAIQSKSEDDAKEAFKKAIVLGWRQLPFFFSPIFNNNTNPENRLSFYSPVEKGKEASDMLMRDDEEELRSWIQVYASGNNACDGGTFHVYWGDEVGKTKEKEANVHKRHGVVKETLATDGIVHGFGMLTSTVEEFEKGGGKQCYSIWKESDPGKLDELGQTTSGLWRYFIPAYDGYKRDKYGISLIEEAKREQKIIRARYKDDPSGLAEYVRKNPWTPEEAFRIDGVDCKFNVTILQNRLSELAEMAEHEYWVKGYFKWKDNSPAGIMLGDPQQRFRPGEVEMVIDGNGPWCFSWMFDDPRESNKWHRNNELCIPDNKHRFSGGADPFKFRITKSGKRSLGGGAIYMKFNPAIDDVRYESDNWKTDRFIASYLFRRKTVAEFCEDMLMASIYYGCEMFPEINVPAVWDHFQDRGFGGFLFYQIDPLTGRYFKTPGANANDKTTEAIFTLYNQHIEKNGHRERHPDILQQCLEIEDDMGDFDVFAAGGYALMAAQKDMLTTTKGTKTDISRYHKLYIYGPDGQKVKKLDRSTSNLLIAA